MGNVASYVVNEVIRDNVHNAVVNYNMNQVHEAIVDKCKTQLSRANQPYRLEFCRGERWSRRQGRF